MTKAPPSRGLGRPLHSGTARPLVWKITLLAAFVIWRVAGDRPCRAATLPDWLAAVAKTEYTPTAKDVPAVVLLSERQATVSESGDVQFQQRRVVRVLLESGAREAYAAVPYLTDTQKVSEFRAFLIKPDGQMKKFGKSEVVDIAASEEDLFNESRIQVLSAAGEASPGDVFGAEWVLKGADAFSQMEWTFQNRLPTLYSRLSIALPESFHLTEKAFGHDVKGIKDRNRMVWEVSNLPFLPDEPYAPPLTTLTPRVAISWFRNTPESGGAPAFASWQAVSRWLWELSEPQSKPDAGITRRATELTSGLTGENARAEALSKAVQSLGYVSVQLGLGRGGGYKPHPAPEVLAKGHGDCKDKATLLRSLLRAAGITSYLVTVYSGDESFVRKEFPSPQQFNHVILGIQLPEIPQGAPVVTDPAGSRLMLFDPTDERVPFGDLPYDDRYGYGLVVKEEGGSLVEIPGAPAGGFRTTHSVTGTLREDGTVEARLEVKGSGPGARHLRSLAYRLSPTDLTRSVEKWLSGPLQGVVLDGTKISEASPGVARLETKLAGRTQSRATGGGLFLFRPAFVAWTGLPSLPAGSRTLPVAFGASAFSSTYEVRLPAGLAVDDLPEKVQLSTAYGEVSMDASVKDGVVTMKHEVKLNRGSWPAREYEALRTFLSKARDALAAVVVLKKTA